MAVFCFFERLVKEKRKMSNYNQPHKFNKLPSRKQKYVVI